MNVPDLVRGGPSRPLGDIALDEDKPATTADAPVEDPAAYDGSPVEDAASPGPESSAPFEPAPVAHEPAAEDAIPATEELAVPWTELQAAVQALSAQVRESDRLLARQTEIAASLHAENLRLRDGELRRAQSALVLSVVSVIDDVRSILQTVTDDAHRSDLDMIADSLVDSLDRNGVVVSPVEVGESFDSARHRVGTVVPTADPELDRTVAGVARSGFSWADGGAIRPTAVVVHKHTPAPAADPATDAETQTVSDAADTSES